MLSLVVHLQNKLLTTAMQGDTCTKNAIDLKHMVAVAININEDDVDANKDSIIEVKYFNDNQMELIEADLNKYQTSERVQQSIKLLRIIRNGLTTGRRFGSETVI